MKVEWPLTCLGVVPNQHVKGGVIMTEISLPALKENELLVEVHTVGVNYADYAQAQGVYPPPADAPATLGLELAGIVRAKGVAVRDFALGDRVMSLVAGGAYAEYAIAQAETTILIPESLSMIEAAAVPESYHTVWYNVMMKGGLQAGEVFLVHGGASGVGSAAIQITKLQGAIVIATASTDAKVQACLTLGADLAINYQKQSFKEAILDFTSGRGIDVILDWVGAQYFAEHMQLLTRYGRLLCINTLTGAETKLDLSLLMRKSLCITGSMLRPLSMQKKAKITQEIVRELIPKLASGAIKPYVYQTFPLAQTETAFQVMQDSKHSGKIVLVNNVVSSLKPSQDER